MDNPHDFMFNLREATKGADKAMVLLRVSIDFD